MIHSIKFESGYPVKLPGIGKRKIEFSDRLNLVIGPNGAGKSTLLRTLADACCCGSGGWSKDDNCTERDEVKGADYSVEHDGKPVFFQDCNADFDRSFLNPSYFDEYSYLRSTGEKRVGLINELINHLEETFLTWKLKKEEKPTIILDEIDNHVGFAGQSVLWKELFPYLVKKYQLIISTHSIFPLLLKRDNSLRQDNIISLHERYEQTCIDELADAVEYYNKNRKKIISPSC